VTFCANAGETLASVRSATEVRNWLLILVSSNGLAEVEATGLL
jgi:hypothetical protein